jgi:ubiquinone/menaquinone biosynthesis C-methylase UbiE
MPVKLNLGCGKDIRKGWENYDIAPKDKTVKHIDLNNLQLPFKNNSIDYILMVHVFEHLDVNRQDFMQDIHRILKPGGIVEINVPRNHTRVQHTIGYFPSTYFDPICKPSLRNWQFKKVSQEYIWDGSIFGYLFKKFKIIEKIFPFMFDGSFVWKLQK